MLDWFLSFYPCAYAVLFLNLIENMSVLRVLYSLQCPVYLHFFFNNSFLWLSSAGNSDKDDGDKHEGVHESTARSNSGYTVF